MTPLVRDQGGRQVSVFGHYVYNNLSRVCGRSVSDWICKKVSGKHIYCSYDVFVASAGGQIR